MTVDTLVMNGQKDAEGEFYRKFNQSGSCGSVRTITASGKVVTGKNWEETLEEFKKLSKEERMPAIGALTNPDPNAPLNRLPKGVLRIKLASRGLERDGKGALVSKDWKERWTKHMGGDWPMRAEPGHDYLWLTETEWQSLVPAELKKGHQFALPKMLIKKLACDPLTHNAWARNPPIWWNPKHVRTLKVELTVDDVAAGRVFMSVHGSVLLEAPIKDAFNGYRAMNRQGEPILGNPQLKFDGNLIGRLVYDQEKGAFTRFDMAALGDYVGFLCDTNGRGEVLSYPLGVAYSLDTGPPVPPAPWHRDDAIFRK